MQNSSKAERPCCTRGRAEAHGLSQFPKGETHSSENCTLDHFSGMLVVIINVV